MGIVVVVAVVVVVVVVVVLLLFCCLLLLSSESKMRTMSVSRSLCTVIVVVCGFDVHLYDIHVLAFVTDVVAAKDENGDNSVLNVVSPGC